MLREARPKELRPFTRGRWHPIGSRGQRPAPLKISSGLADFLSSDGGKEEKEGKKRTFFIFLFLFFFFPISSSCILFGSIHEKSLPISTTIHVENGKKGEDKKSAKGGKCKSTCRHNLRESICLYRSHLLLMGREIEMCLCLSCVSIENRQERENFISLTFICGGVLLCGMVPIS